MSSKRPGWLGLPLGLIALVAVAGTAVVSAILLQVGISERRGGLIAVGVLLGAFWLMFLAQTVATLTRSRRAAGEGHEDPTGDDD